MRKNMWALQNPVNHQFRGICHKCFELLNEMFSTDFYSRLNAMFQQVSNTLNLAHPLKLHDYWEPVSVISLELVQHELHYIYSKIYWPIC